MIELAPFGVNDCPRLIRWIDSPRLLAQWGRWKFRFPLDEKQLEDYLRETTGESPSRIVFKSLHSSEVVGHIELNAINRGNGTASICRVFVAPEHRGKGFARDMLRMILNHGFGTLGLRRIDLQVFDFNQPALACYESVGFVREGVLRQYAKVGDECWNLVWMGLLRNEWKGPSA